MALDRNKKNNKGSTLIEMLVCFALLGIFMSAAAVVVANVTNVYFDVKGETYGRQVSEIILGKITGEIEGAKVSLENPYTQPVIYQEPADAMAGNRFGFKMDLYDRTDTHIQMYAEDGQLKIRYLEINPEKEDSTPEYKEGHYDETTWTFDDAVYQGFYVKDLKFVQANQGIGNAVSQNTLPEKEAYGEDNDVDYPGNVIGVYLTLQSSQYGEFYAYRYVRMYNLGEEDAKDYVIPLLTTTDYDR